jgi:phosphoglucomutase
MYTLAQSCRSSRGVVIATEIFFFLVLLRSVRVRVGGSVITSSHNPPSDG